MDNFGEGYKADRDNLQIRLFPQDDVDKDFKKDRDQLVLLAGLDLDGRTAVVQSWLPPPGIAASWFWTSIESSLVYPMRQHLDAKARTAREGHRVLNRVLRLEGLLKKNLKHKKKACK